MDHARSPVASASLARWFDLGVTLAVFGIVLPTAIAVLTFLSFLVFPLVPFIGFALLPLLVPSTAASAPPPQIVTRDTAATPALSSARTPKHELALR